MNIPSTSPKLIGALMEVERILKAHPGTQYMDLMGQVALNVKCSETYAASAITDLKKSGHVVAPAKKDKEQGYHWNSHPELKDEDHFTVAKRINKKAAECKPVFVNRIVPWLG